MNIFKLLATRIFAGDKERRALDDYMRVEFKNEYRRLKKADDFNHTGHYVLDTYRNRRYRM